MCGSKTPLLCIFYAEFDNVVGPVVCRQAPEGFMDIEIGSSYEQIEKVLKASFAARSNGSVHKRDKDPKFKEQMEGRDVRRTLDESESNQDKAASPFSPPSHTKNKNGLSIFDATCEYIITGRELADKMICLCTHNLQILSRPTIISNSYYERNALLFSVGFVLRNDIDARPYRPVLEKLASVLRVMEIESQYLSNLHQNHKHTSTISPQNSNMNRYMNFSRFQHIQDNSNNHMQQTLPHLDLQQVLKSIIFNLNSPNAECNIFIDEVNPLNLKLFNPLKPLTSPVPDYVVPILLRPEWQLQLFDWDLTVNWIVPHIDGLKYVRLISQSPEVDMDMEMVRACIRVLKHHRVIDFVDIFKYSNIYECTPLATSILCNISFTPSTNVESVGDGGTSRNSREHSLLTEAFDYAAKVSKKDSLVTNMTANNHNIKNTPITVPGPVAAAPPTGVLTNATTTSFSSSCVSTSPPSSSSQHNALISATGHSSINASPAIHSQKQIQIDHHPQSQENSTNDSIATAAGSSSIREKERNLMKIALAQLYCSCHRNTSFFDLIVSKMTDDASSNNMATFVSNDSTEKKRSLDSKTEQHDLTIAEWTRVLDFFDHRRIITFGVLHGWIRRVHCFPLAYDIYNSSNSNDDDEDTDADMYEESTTTTTTTTNTITNMGAIDIHGNTMGKETTQNNKKDDTNVPFIAIQNSTNTLQEQHNEHIHVSNKVTSEKKLNLYNVDNHSAIAYNEKDLVFGYKIAAEMDGTKCDDELCCMFGMDLEKLIHFVKNTGTKDVAKIYSCCKKKHKHSG